MDRTILLDFETLRMCGECHTHITLEKELDRVVYKGNTVFHSECMKKKILAKRYNKLTEEQVEDSIRNLVLVGRPHVERLIYKNHLYKFLMRYYDVIDFSNRVYTKMEQIFIGKFRNFSRAVPPEHLLGIWQKKRIQYILSKNYRNLDHEDKFHYDLAIVVREYPSYADWMAKKTTEDKRIEEQLGEERPNMNAISSQVIVVETEPEEDIFSDIET